ncbi:hypothetical protein BM1_10998 [Bipolaris maydis]|nr:hypothetical protein BM1_10998 [Bipolaris maydis]
MSYQRTSGEEAAPFLDHTEDNVEKQELHKGASMGHGKKTRIGCLVLFHICFILINILWLAANVVHSNAPTKSPKNRPNFVEPKDAPIEWKAIRWNLPAGKRSNFTSFDREVADAAWKTRDIGPNRGYVEPNTYPNVPSDGCGSSIEEATSLGCKFDLFTSTWIPSACYDHTIAKYPGSNDDALYSESRGMALYPAFWDEELTQPATHHDVMSAAFDNVLSGDNITFWRNSTYHVIHCLR